MWDETLIESRRTRAEKKRWMTIAFSVGFPTLVVAFIIGASFWYLEAVTPQVPTKTPYLRAAGPPQDVVIKVKLGTQQGNNIAPKNPAITPVVQQTPVTQESVNANSELPLNDTSS